MSNDLSARRLAAIGILSWLAMLGVDFLLHGGLLAGLYAQAAPFLLPAPEAFRRIPLGYLSFLLLAVLLVWLMARIGISGWRRGLVFGLQLGVLTWGAVVLGLLSISSAPLDLLLGWWLGQSLELGLAGAVAGQGFEGEKLRSLMLGVLGLLVVLVLITIVLQNVGTG